MSAKPIFADMRRIRQELLDRSITRVIHGIYCDPLGLEWFKKEFKEHRMIRPEEGSVEEAIEDSYPVDHASYWGIPIVTLEALPEDVMAIVGLDKTIIRIGKTGKMYEVDGPLSMLSLHLVVNKIMQEEADGLAEEIPDVS